MKDYTINSKLQLLTLSPFQQPFPGEPGSVGYIGVEDDGSGGYNWSYKTCKASVKSQPSTNCHPTFYRQEAHPVAQPTVPKH